MEGALTALATSIPSTIDNVINIVKRHKSNSESIRQNLSRNDVNERVINPLLEMYENLTKTNTTVNIYSRFLIITTDPFRSIFVQNHSDYFLNNIDSYLGNFNKILVYFDEKAHSQFGIPVVESIKGNSCFNRDKVEDELKKKFDSIKTIKSMGGLLNVNNITDLLDRVKDFSDCYYKGVIGTIDKATHLQ